MYLPDYNGGSIVNLMSSIGNALGAKMPYPELKILYSKELRKTKNIVLIVIDGLGYDYLLKKDGSFLRYNTKGKMTSVFPPTTAAGVTTFLTGVSTQQHALTGWFVYLKEIGIVTMILPFCPRIGGMHFNEQGFKMEEFIGAPAFTSRIKAKSFVVQLEEIAHSAYSEANSKKAKIIEYNNLNDFFLKIEKVVKFPGKRKYIYGYWSNIDSACHKFGVGSKECEQQFKKLDRKMRQFIKKIQGTGTTVILTSDHGIINSTQNELIKLEDHPNLMECLTLPLSGEGRLPYCYVRPSKVRQFERYIRKNLSKYCQMFKSEELIKRGFYGLGKPNKKLFDRVGDYILVMKKNYLLKDKIEKKTEFHIGNHGGVSKEEIFVPLIVIKT